MTLLREGVHERRGGSKNAPGSTQGAPGMGTAVRTLCAVPGATEADEATRALLDMVLQYLCSEPDWQPHHQFMSAGEHACEVLTNLGWLVREPKHAVYTWAEGRNPDSWGW